MQKKWLKSLTQKSGQIITWKGYYANFWLRWLDCRYDGGDDENTRQDKGTTAERSATYFDVCSFVCNQTGIIYEWQVEWCCWLVATRRQKFTLAIAFPLFIVLNDLFVLYWLKERRHRKSRVVFVSLCA